MKKKYLLILPLLFGVVFAAATRTLNFETWTTLLSNQDLTITPSGTGVLNVDSDILMSGTGQIDLPVGTTAQRSGSPNSGMLRFNSETSSFEGYNGSAWGSIGGGGGGLDVFYDEDHESATDSSDYTTGLNATFDNGGTLGGALADETTNPIAGATSIKYTTSATATNSTNDWIASASITLDDKQKGNFVGFNFFYTWDGSDDLLCVIVWDDTNNAVLNDSTDCLETASNPTRYSLGVFIPTSTNAIKLGFHHTGASESSKVLVFDDLELSSNPFVYKELASENVYSAIISGTTVSSQSSSFISSVTNPSTGIYTITFIPGLFSETPQINVTPSTLNARLATTSNESSSGVTVRILNTNGALAISDFSIKVQKQGADYQAPAEHVVTPAKAVVESARFDTHAGYGSTNTFTPYFSNERENTVSQLGTITNNSTNGFRFTASEHVYVSIQYTTRTDSNGNDYWGISRNPSGDTTDITSLSADERLSLQGQGVSVDRPNSVSAVTELSVGEFIDIRHSGAWTPTSTAFSAVQIIVQKAEAEFLAAVPVPLVAILKDVKSSGTAGGTFTSGSWQTRTLNTVEGDSEIVSLSSNQFTLQRGKYIIEGMAPAQRVIRHKTRIYDVTNSAEAIIGTSSYASNTDTGSSASDFSGVIEISSPTTYRLEHRCETTKTSNGFGVESNFGNDEVYATVKITKLK